MRLALVLTFMSFGTAFAVPERLNVVYVDASHVYVAWSAGDGGW